MKNIIKRATSLLLVLAMLLSFAAVTGAEQGSENPILTLAVQDVALKAGEAEYVPVYATVNGDYGIRALQFLVVGDAGVTVNSIETTKQDEDAAMDKGNPEFQKLEDGSWKVGWMRNQNLVVSNSDGTAKVLCWIVVEATTEGNYSLNLQTWPNDNYTFSTVVGNESKVDHNDDEAAFVDGSITVLPAGAELPTLIMTQTSFPRPTKEQDTLSYDLAQYVKLVNADGSVTNAENLSVTGKKVVGDKLQLSYTDNGSTTVTVSAGGLSKQITLDITSGSPVLTSVKFVNKLEKSYTAPAPGEASPKTIDLDIRAYDQYDDVMQNAATRAILKVGNEEPGENSPVYLSGNQICIRSDLASDVNCTVTPVAEGLDKREMPHSFTVKSSLPKATELTIEGGTTELQVPVEGQTSTATFTASLKDQYGQDCTLELPQWSVSLEGVENGQLTNYVTSSTTENGAQITVTLLPKAKELLADKNQVQLTLTITANGLTSGGKTVQIQKATPTATSLGYYGYDYSSEKYTYHKDVIHTNITQLQELVGGYFYLFIPGVGEEFKQTVSSTEERKWTIDPLYVLDQYDQPMLDENGKKITVPAEAFKLYSYANKQLGDVVDCTITPQDSEGKMVITLVNKLVDGKLSFPAGDYIIRADYSSLAAYSGTSQFSQRASTPTRATITEVGEPGDIEVPVGSDTVERKFQIAVYDQYGAPMSDAEQYAEILLDGDEVAEQTGITPNTENGLVTISVDASAKETIADTTGKKLTINVTNSTGHDGVTEVKTLESKELTIKCAAPVLSDVTFTVSGAVVTKTAEGNSSAVLPAPTASANVKISSVKDQYGESFINHYEVTPAQATGFTWSDAAFGWTVTLTAEAANQSGTLTVKDGDKTFTLTLTGITLTFQNSQDKTPTLNDFLNDIDNLEYNGETFAQFLIAHAIATPAVTASEPDGTPVAGTYSKLFYEDNNGQRGDAILDTGEKVMNAGTYWVVTSFTSSDSKYENVEVCADQITVAKKQLTLGGNTSGSKTLSKEYDGGTGYSWKNTDVWTDYVRMGGIADHDADSISLDQFKLTVTFIEEESETPSKDVGAKRVKFTATDAALTGDRAKNYTFGPDGASCIYPQGEITKRTLKIEVHFKDREWDGSANAPKATSVTISETTPIIDGDEVSVSQYVGVTGWGFVDEKGNRSTDAGAILPEGKEVEVSLSGADAGNYQTQVSYNGGENGAKIIPAALELDYDKAYRTYTYGEDASNLSVPASELKYKNGFSLDSALATEIGSLTLEPVGAEKSGSENYTAGEYEAQLVLPEGEKNYTVTFNGTPKPKIKINPKTVQLAQPGAVRQLEKEYDGKYDTYTWKTNENEDWTSYFSLPSRSVLAGDSVRLNENQTGISVEFLVEDGLEPSKDAGEKNVRLEIPVAGALTGADAGNYTIGGADINGVLTGYRDGEITPKHIKVTIEAQDKPWDSTNSLDGALWIRYGGWVDGEALGVDVAENGLTFNGTDVGSWISDDSADLAKITWAFHKLHVAKYQHTILENYTVTREDVTFKNFGKNGAKIKPVTLTLKGVQSRNGTYGDADGTLLALGEGVTVVRPRDGSSDYDLTDELRDMVRLFPGGATKTGDYYNANQWPYTLGAVLDGVNPNNYTLYVANDPTLTINPKTVTVALEDGVTITKTYDGTNDLPDEITENSFEVTGAVGTDVLTVDPGKMTYSSENVGNDIPLSVDSGLLKATSGLVSNYQIDSTTETAFSGAITAREITVTPKADQTFEYGSDQIAAALASAYDVTNNLDGEHAAKLTGSMALLSTDAGTPTVTQGDLALASESAQNYTLKFTDDVTWEIMPKTVDTVTASIEAEFGKSTDELLALLGEADVTIGTETVKLRDLGQTLTFPTLTSEQYAVDENQKQYPVPGTYTVTVQNPTTVQRNNYQVTAQTNYTLRVTVNESQKALTVDLYTDEGHTTAYTDQSFSYNGEEQKVFAEYRFQLDNGTSLRLPPVSMDGETGATNAGTYTVRFESPCCQPGSAKWKINKRQIKAALKGDLSAPYGTELNDLLTVSADKLTVTATDGGALPSGDKAPRWSGKLKVNGTKNAAGYYDVGAAFDVGVETLQETSGNYEVIHDDVIGKLVVTKNANTPFTTNPVKASVTRGAEATIQIPTGYRFTNDKDHFRFGPLKDETGADAEILTKPAEIVLSQGSNGSLSVKVSIQDDASLVGKAYTLPLTLADCDNHGAFTVELKLTVTDKPQQTGFAAKDPSDNAEGSYSYSQASVLLHAENAKGNVTWASEDETIAKVETNGKVTFYHPGTVRIKAVSDETGGYAEATAYYTLTVTMGQITVTASSATMTANDPLPSFTATATGLNPMDSVSDVFQTLTASVSTDGKTAGTFRVTPYAVFKTGGTAKHWDDYYTLAFVPGTLTVLPATSVIDTVLPLIIGGNGCANGYANCACESFYDLDAGRWYHEAIDWAYNLGLMNGTTKTTFGPNAAATRAQTWTMLARIAGQDTGRSSTWYEVGRTWAMGLGITDGANPMGTLTREQLAAMLYRYVGSPAVSGALRFADSASVSSWARDAMVWAVQNGILDGVGGNRLNPKGTTTRAQAAAIFMRFQKLMNR